MGLTGSKQKGQDSDSHEEAHVIIVCAGHVLSGAINGCLLQRDADLISLHLCCSLDKILCHSDKSFG